MEQYITKSDTILRTANGEKLTIRGKINIGITIEGYPETTWEMELMIVDGIGFNLILGMSFMTKNNLILDCRNRRCFNKDINISLHPILTEQALEGIIINSNKKEEYKIRKIENRKDENNKNIINTTLNYKISILSYTTQACQTMTQKEIEDQLINNNNKGNENTNKVISTQSETGQNKELIVNSLWQYQDKGQSRKIGQLREQNNYNTNNGYNPWANPTYQLQNTNISARPQRETNYTNQDISSQKLWQQQHNNSRYQNYSDYQITKSYLNQHKDQMQYEPQLQSYLNWIRTHSQLPAKIEGTSSKFKGGKIPTLDAKDKDEMEEGNINEKVQAPVGEETSPGINKINNGEIIKETLKNEVLKQQEIVKTNNSTNEKKSQIQENSKHLEVTRTPEDSSEKEYLQPKEQRKKNKENELQVTEEKENQQKLQKEDQKTGNKEISYNSDIILAQNLRLPKSSEWYGSVIIKIIKPLKSGINYVGMIQSTTQFEINYPRLKLARSVGIFKEIMTIGFINMNPMEVLLRKGTTIGIFTELTKRYNISEYNTGMPEGITLCTIHEERKKTEKNEKEEDMSEVDPTHMEEQIIRIAEKHPWIEEIDFGELSRIQQWQMYKLLDRHEGAFSKHPLDLGTTPLYKHEIKTTTNTPIRKHNYRIEHSKREALDNLVGELQAAGVIRKSTSVYNNPILLVSKKDGSYRLCVDFRALNNIIEPQIYPLPLLQDALDVLNNQQYFSSLDMRSGFFQIELTEDSARKTAFTTHNGKFEFVRLPQGLSTSPAIFQSLMTLVLGHLIYKHAVVYLDDILIFGSDFETHQKNLTYVLQAMSKAQLKLKPKKCSICKNSVKFLGHKVSQEGVLPDENNISAIKNYPVPKTKKEIRGFMGICNYYRKFIENFAELALPIYKLTKHEGKFTWNNEAQIAFINLKSKLITPPVLRHPNLEETFYLFTDASDYAVGAVLSQVDDKNQDFAISYFSKKLNETERKYSTIDKELYAVVLAVNQFKSYLTIKKFYVITDHRPLTYLKRLGDANPRHMRWVMKLQEYQFTIIHRSGKSNVNADVMSRNPVYKEPHEFKNPMINYLEKETPLNSEVKKWKEQISKDLGLIIDKSSEERSSGLSQEEDIQWDPDNDSMFKKISEFLTGSENEHSSIRTMITIYERENREFFKENYIDTEDKTELHHFRKIENGASGTKIELYAMSGLLGLPIIVKNLNKKTLYLGATEKWVSREPPDGLFLNMELDNIGKYYLLDNITKIEDSVIMAIKSTKPLPEIHIRIPNTEELIVEQLKDEYCKQWFDYINNKTIPSFTRKHFEINKDIIKIDTSGALIMKPRSSIRQNRQIENPRVILPEALVPVVINAFHDHKLATHPGPEKCYENIAFRFYKPNLKALIIKYIQDCVLCYSKKSKYRKSRIPVQKMERALSCFSRVHIDVLGPLSPPSEGNKYILVVVCAYSKWCEAYPLKDQTSETLAKCLVTEYICRFGIPEIFCMDNGSNFNSRLMRDLYKQLGISHVHTTPYNPAGNGQCERYNKTIVDGLRMLVDQYPHNWSSMLPFVLFSMRNSINLTTKETPSFVVYGKDVNLPVDLMLTSIEDGKYALGIDKTKYSVETAIRMKKATEFVTQNTQDSIEKYTNQANKKVRMPPIDVGSLVMIDNPKVTKGSSKKLMRTHIGPYRVIERISEVNLKLQGLGSRKSAIVHIRRMLPYENSTDYLRETLWNEIPDNLYEEAIDNMEIINNKKEVEDGKKNNLKSWDKRLRNK